MTKINLGKKGVVWLVFDDPSLRKVREGTEAGAEAGTIVEYCYWLAQEPLLNIPGPPSSIKTVPHRPVWWRQFFIWGSLSQVSLSCPQECTVVWHKNANVSILVINYGNVRNWWNLKEVGHGWKKLNIGVEMGHALWGQTKIKPFHVFFFASWCHEAKSPLHVIIHHATISPKQQRKMTMWVKRDFSSFYIYYLWYFIRVTESWLIYTYTL